MTIKCACELNVTMDNYPACLDCAMIMHFDRDDCIHCFMDALPSNQYTDADIDAMYEQYLSGQCSNPDCIDGIVHGGEYITRYGDVDWYTYDCTECKTAKRHVWSDTAIQDEFIPF